MTSGIEKLQQEIASLQEQNTTLVQQCDESHHEMEDLENRLLMENDQLQSELDDYKALN